MAEYLITTKSGKFKVTTGGASSSKEVSPTRGMFEGATSGMMGAVSRTSKEDIPGIASDIADAISLGTLRPSLKRPIMTSMGGPSASQFKEGAMQVKERPLEIAKRFSMMGPSSLLTNQPSKPSYGGIELPHPKTFAGNITSLGLQTGLGLGGERLGEAITPTPAKYLAKAEKLTSELIQPSKAMTHEYTKAGEKAPVIKEAVRNIKPSKTYEETLSQFNQKKNEVFTQRNEILDRENFEIGNQYIVDSENDLRQMLKNGEITEGNYKNALKVLEEEKRLLGKSEKNLDRVLGTERKTNLGKLAREAAGGPEITHPGTKVGYEILRRNLKKHVEAGNPEIAKLNSMYEGLEDATESLATQADILGKVTPQKWYQKMLPIGFAGKKFGALSQTVREIAEAGASIPKTTKKISKYYSRGASAEKPLSYQAPKGIKTYPEFVKQAEETARRSLWHPDYEGTKSGPISLAEGFEGWPNRVIEPSKYKQIGYEPFQILSPEEAQVLRQGEAFQKYAGKQRLQEMGPGIARKTMAVEQAKKGSSIASALRRATNPFRGKISYE